MPGSSSWERLVGGLAQIAIQHPPGFRRLVSLFPSLLEWRHEAELIQVTI